MRGVLLKHIDDIIRERLKLAVEHSGYSQSKVAEMAGISRINLNRLFAGARQGVTPETIYKICKALDVPMAFVFGEIDEYGEANGSKCIFTSNSQEKLSYGELLRNLLDAKGLNQTEAAELIGIDRKVFSAYTRNKREPSMETWTRIAVALQVPVGYFYNELTLGQALQCEIVTGERAEKLGKLHSLLKDLDDEGVEKIIEATEKEKIYKDHQKIVNSKKIS